MDNKDDSEVVVGVGLDELVVADKGMTVWRWENAPAHLRAHLEERAPYLAYIPPEQAQDPGLRALCPGMLAFEQLGDEGYVVAFQGAKRGTVIGVKGAGVG